MKKIIRKERTVRRRVWKLKDHATRVNFEERARELIDVDARNLWKSFKDGLLQACDEVCGKKRRRNDQGNTWW